MSSRPWIKTIRPEGRQSGDVKFYNSSQWRRLTKYMSKVQPFCKMCEKNGIYTPGDVTDHIKPIKQGGAKYDLENLQRLCLKCHAKKSGTEKNGQI